MSATSGNGTLLKRRIMLRLLNKPDPDTSQLNEATFYADLLALQNSGINNLTVFLNYYKGKNPDLYQKIKDNLDLSTLIATREKNLTAINNTVTDLTHKVDTLENENKQLQQKVSSLKKENLELNERMKQMETFLKQQFNYSNKKETEEGSVNKNVLFRMTY